MTWMSKHKPESIVLNRLTDPDYILPAMVVLTAAAWAVCLSI